MIVVADSSPIVVLVNIGHSEVLPRLFGQVIVPPQVAKELGAEARPLAVRQFIAAAPGWLEIRTPKKLEAIPDLHTGEIAAICLARESGADLLLIDDAAGRQAATERLVPITGTIGVLGRAADAGLLDLADAIESVKATDFWVSARLLDDSLRRHRECRGDG